VAENDHPPLTWHIALTTVYALTCYTVIVAGPIENAGLDSVVDLSQHIRVRA